MLGNSEQKCSIAWEYGVLASKACIYNERVMLRRGMYGILKRSYNIYTFAVGSSLSLIATESVMVFPCSSAAVNCTDPMCFDIISMNSRC